jgi:hypothetical protein
MLIVEQAPSFIKYTFAFLIGCASVTFTYTDIEKFEESHVLFSFTLFRFTIRFGLTYTQFIPYSKKHLEFLDTQYDEVRKK